ncbi:hypothetical protein [Sphingomonas sp. LH128]|uniref:hypothetical protein n=1 Tax=Sphingomonas sp. LH128 TaxID=473781 RepID=UPI0002DC5B6E|nr:hypothetical protein [Sphingomonas sp. LH128]
MPERARCHVGELQASQIVVRYNLYQVIENNVRGNALSVERQITSQRLRNDLPQIPLRFAVIMATAM